MRYNALQAAGVVPVRKRNDNEEVTMSEVYEYQKNGYTAPEGKEFGGRA